MHGILVVEVKNDKQKTDKEKSSGQGNSTQEHPFVKEIEREIERVELAAKEFALRHAVLLLIRDDLLEMVGIKKNPDEKKDEPEKPETQEPEKQEPVKSEITKEKIDDEPGKTLSESMLKRLKVLEQVVQNYSEKLGEAKITGRFKQIGELHQKFEKCLSYPNNQKDSMEYLVKLEATVGDALDFLGTSKLAGRFNLLKELRVELGEALTDSRRS